MAVSTVVKANESVDPHYLRFVDTCPNKTLVRSQPKLDRANPNLCEPKPSLVEANPHVAEANTPLTQANSDWADDRVRLNLGRSPHHALFRVYWLRTSLAMDNATMSGVPRKQQDSDTLRTCSANAILAGLVPIEGRHPRESGRPATRSNAQPHIGHTSQLAKRYRGASLQHSEEVNHRPLPWTRSASTCGWTVASRWPCAVHKLS